MEWFEPRPPKIAAMQIQFTKSAGDLVEKLREMPIRKVTVEYTANDDPYAVLLKAHATSDPLVDMHGCPVNAPDPQLHS